MEELIKAIQGMIGGARGEFNKAIAKLPPLEQFEANQSLAWGFQFLQSTCSDFISQLTRLDADLMEKFGKAQVLAEAAGLEKALTAKLVMAVADHEAAVNAAATGAREDERKSLTAQFEQQLKAEQARAVLLEGVPTALAQLVPAEALVGDGATQNAKALKDRLKKLADAGCANADSAFLQEIAGLGFDAAGNAAFETRSTPIIDSYNAGKGGARTPPPAARPNPAAGSGGSGAAVSAKDF